MLVHVCRHGLVHNPENVLYARLPGFHLSARGQQMAGLLARHFADTPITHFRVSPMERARETMAPIAALHPDVPVVVDWRLIEADSRMQGQKKGPMSLRLVSPANWRYFIHPITTSWGEGFAPMAARVLAAIADAAYDAGPEGQAVLVSHQAPIWTARRMAEGKSLFNVPAMRHCTLGSVTSFAVHPDGSVLFAGYEDVVGSL